MKTFLKKAVRVWCYNRQRLKHPEKWARKNAKEASWLDVTRTETGGHLAFHLGSGLTMEAEAESWPALCAFVKEARFAHCSVSWRIPSTIPDKGVP